MFEEIKQKISELFNKKYLNTAVFLLDVQVLTNNKILVFADSDTGLSIDTCVQISRYLASYLDEDEEIQGDYSLEVSSPGIDLPLKVHRQYKKNVGRQVQVILQNDNKESGLMILVDDDKIRLEHQEFLSKGRRKNKSVPNFKNIELSNIKEIKVQATF